MREWDSQIWKHKIKVVDNAARVHRADGREEHYKHKENKDVRIEESDSDEPSAVPAAEASHASNEGPGQPRDTDSGRAEIKLPELLRNDDTLSSTWWSTRILVACAAFQIIKLKSVTWRSS